MAFDGSIPNVNPTFNSAHGEPIDLTKGGPLISSYNQAQSQIVPDVDTAKVMAAVPLDYTTQESPQVNLQLSEPI